MTPHVLRVARAGAERDHPGAERLASACDDAELVQPVPTLLRVRMNHVERAGDRLDGDALFRRRLANAFGQRGINLVRQAGQPGAREVELHAAQMMLRHGAEDFRHRRARKGFGEDAGDHNDR